MRRLHLLAEDVLRTQGASRCARPICGTAIVVLIASVLVACAGRQQGRTADRTQPYPEATRIVDPDAAFASANIAHARAAKPNARNSAAQWIHCATSAFIAMDATEQGKAQAAASLATRCTEGFLLQAIAKRRAWQRGSQNVLGERIVLELRDASPNLAPTMSIVLATDVSMAMYRGRRNLKPGFGVPVAIISERCTGEELCKLLPVSGVFRSATAWFEPGGEGQDPRLVLGHPDRTGAARSGSRLWPLAMDSSAFYAAGLRDSPVQRLAIWSLFGGRALGRRAGVYLLEDYDPNKRPLIMVHGLASSPLTWASMSNAVWADPLLRTRYQIWQLVYQTNDPMLVARLRVEKQLDEAWSILDPEGRAPARHCVVLIGHSMGGVISRLLTVDSGDRVWNAAFTRPSSSLRGNVSDLDSLDQVFRFKPYPGVNRAIFLAAPHRGSPTADAVLGRITHSLMARNTPEIRILQRVARENQDAVPDTLREAFLRGRINSITTLRESEPVMRATHALLPSRGIPYHTISGYLPGTDPPGDGIVSLSSTELPGTASHLVVASGHNVHENDRAISEVLRILRLELEERKPTGGCPLNTSQEGLY